MVMSLSQSQSGLARSQALCAGPTCQRAALTSRPTTTWRHHHTVRTAAEENGRGGRGGLGTQERPDLTSSSGDGTNGKGAGVVNELQKAASQLPKEEAEQIYALYKFLVQHPEARIQRLGFREIEALYVGFQTVLWRPAELLNGRLAMLGFVSAVGNELITKQTVFEQLYRQPLSYFIAYLLVVTAGQLNRQFGSPQEGISLGPIKFSKTAELLNARAAMIGYVILTLLSYNLESRKAAYFAVQQLAGRSTGV